jgi:hypothetical protein
MNHQAQASNLTKNAEITPDAIVQLGFAFWGSKTLLSAVELGLFTLLADSPLSAEALMARLKLHSRGVRDFLDALVALGQLERNSDLYSNTPAGALFADTLYQIWMMHTPKGEVIDDQMGYGRAINELVSYSGDTISMYTHCGTHVDAMNHFGYNGEIFNHFKADEHIGSRTWNICGAEKHPPVIARGVLLDVAALHNLDELPPSFGIGPKEIDDCLKHQDTKLQLGDVVVIRTGRMRAWPDPA